MRPATASDAAFLCEMLAAAADWRAETPTRAPAAVMDDSQIAHYVAGWPREDDFGVVADDCGAPVGAAWCRFFPTRPRGYGFVAADVPELTIGVSADRRGEGVGRLLLMALILEASRRGTRRVSLSVESDNPAIDLYRSVGFVEVSGSPDAPTMVVDCDVTPSPYNPCVWYVNDSEVPPG